MANGTEESVIANMLNMGTGMVRIGRWMSENEYSTMVETGSVYVEFDVESSRVFPAGKDGWGQIPGPGSLIDRLNIKKGFPAFEDMPTANNIQIEGRK